MKNHLVLHCEELIDLVLDSALKSNIPVALSGIIQAMEDGHGFILQQKRLSLYSVRFHS